MTENHTEAARRYLLAEVRFHDLLAVFKAGGFQMRDSIDLRICMERGWRFGRVLKALERHGKLPRFRTREAMRNAERSYEAAMEVLEPYYRDLAAVLKAGGFEGAWHEKVLRSCLKRGYDFARFRAMLAERGVPLDFRDDDARWVAEMSYQTVLTHGRTITRLYTEPSSHAPRKW